MKTDQKRVRGTTIKANGKVFFFPHGTAIPQWLEKETDQAIKEHRATIKFGD